jgi:endoglucanase
MAAAALVAGVAGHAPAAGAQTTAGGPDGVMVSVVGNQLVDASGHPIQLRGVDRSGTEYACAEGWGIFDGPSDATSVAAMQSWHVNAVRVPLNEDCWLGINGVSAAVGGSSYRTAIEAYVHELNQAGIVAVIDLHWGAPGNELATGQESMPDADHAVAFWTSAAGAVGGTPGGIFDLFNEPHDVSWSCWLNGCEMSGGWQAVGMQTLVDTVRSTGATQPIMVEPLGYGGDLSGFLANEPVDPDHQLVASLHLYNPSGCNTLSCWNSVIAPVAARLPVVTGELGEYDCSSAFVESYMAWADAHGVSYLGWTWDAGGGWTCSSGPALIQDYSGTPNAFGAGFEDHLASLATVHTSYALGHSWGDGGIGQLTVTNTGSHPVGTTADPWTIRFALTTPTVVSSMWNAVLTSDSDGVVVATAPSYTPVLAPGQSISIGYVIGGGQAPPSEIDVDGVATGS